LFMQICGLMFVWIDNKVKYNFGDDLGGSFFYFPFGRLLIYRFCCYE